MIPSSDTLAAAILPISWWKKEWREDPTYVRVPTARNTLVLLRHPESWVSYPGILEVSVGPVECLSQLSGIFQFMMSDSTNSDPSGDVAHHVGHVDSLKLALGLCLCYTLCFACLRGYIRWRAYGPDDFVVLLSTILALGFFVSGYISSQAGLGHPASDFIDEPQSTVDRLNKAILAGNLTWILALSFSKVAVVAILMRTSQTPSHRRVQWVALAAITAQCIASIVLIIAACQIDDGLSWDFRSNVSSCSKQDLRWQIITGLDIATELILLVLPVHLTWKLQMSLKTKIIVITAFWLRLPTIAFTVLRDTATHTLATTSDTLLASALVVIWQAVELSYSLAAVTIAALKSFTENLNTGFGHGELVRVHGNSQAYKMSDLSNNSKLARSKGDMTATVKSIDPPVRPQSPLTEQIRLRPESVRNEATITSPGHRSGSNSFSIRNIDNSIGDSSSDENVILQEIQYSVRYDEAPLCQRR